MDWMLWPLPLGDGASATFQLMAAGSSVALALKLAELQPSQ